MTTSYRDLVLGDDLAPHVPAEVSIVVVTHESVADIGDCLASLGAATERTAEVIVVDNASRDGSADLVNRMFPTIRLIRKNRRHGFATNVNIGAAAASGRYVLVLNPDTVVAPGAIDALADFLDAHADVAAVGPGVVYPDGRPQATARRFPTFATTLVRRTPLRLLVKDTAGIRHHEMADEQPVEGADVDWLLGAAILLRRSAFDEIGGMDDGYRLYCEDIDLAWRLHEAGWRVCHLPSARVQHAWDNVTSKRFLTVRTVWHFRSMIRFVRIHGLGRPQPVTRRISTPRTVPATIDLTTPALLEVGV